MENNNKKTYLNEDNPSFTLTVLTSENGNQNKKYSIEDGKIAKEAIAHLYKGSFEVKHFNFACELNKFLDNLMPNQAVSIGIPHLNDEVISSGRITAKSTDEEGAINRTKEYFKLKIQCYSILMTLIWKLTT